MSYQDEKYRLAILQFLILNIIVFCAIWFQTFLGFVSIAPFMFFIITIASSRLTKEGQLLYNQWGLFMSKLKEGEVDIKKFKEHLEEYHLNGSSIHEENGHYFTVDQKFRNKINSLYEQE